MADISKITLPDGVTYDIKDAVARDHYEINLGTINSTTSATLPLTAVQLIGNKMMVNGLHIVTVKGISGGNTYYANVDTVTSTGSTWYMKGHFLTGTTLPTGTTTKGYYFMISCPATSTSATVAWAAKTY